MISRIIQIVACILLAAMASVACAADIQPGLWELVMETRVAASPDISSAPYTMNQCLTAQDAQDPSRILGSVANPGATDCIYTEKSFVGSTFNFMMQCAGSFGIQARGEITFSATSMEGSIVSTANTAGQLTGLRSMITARRLGGC